MNMQTRTLLLSLLAAGALAGCCTSGLEQQEDSYRAAVGRLEQVVDKGDQLLKLEALDRKASFQQAYQQLPAGEQEREQALGQLNLSMTRYLAEVEGKVAVLEQARAIRELREKKPELAAFLEQYAGTWTGVSADGTTLELTFEPGGMVRYAKKSNGQNTSLNVPLQFVRPDAFEIGMMGLNTTFTIQQPAQQVEGRWQATIDGVVLLKADPAAAVAPVVEPPVPPVPPVPDVPAVPGVAPAPEAPATPRAEPAR